VDVRLSAVLVDSDGVEAKATVLDLSSEGFRIEGCGSPRVGEQVSLRVDRGTPLPAMIRWVLGNEAGGVFLRAPLPSG